MGGRVCTSGWKPLEKSPWRLKRGGNVKTVDSRAPGAGRSSSTFCHETEGRASEIPAGTQKLSVAKRTQAGVALLSGRAVDERLAREEASLSEVAKILVPGAGREQQRGRPMEKCDQPES